MEAVVRCSRIVLFLALALLPVLAGAAAVVRAGPAPALAERLDRAIAAALVELDRVAAGAAAPPGPAELHPAGVPVPLDASAGRLAARRLDRLLAHIGGLLGEAEAEAGADRLVRRLLGEARRRVVAARGALARPDGHDAGSVREALLRADAAAAALWSLPAPRPP